VAAPQAPSTTVALTELPAEVRKIVQERQAGAEIDKISEETWGEHTVYVVAFKDEAHHPKLYVLADGSLLIPASK
jgi:hypothetical protein